VAVAPGGAHQRQVALVEETHGGYEPGPALARERLAQLGDGADGPHDASSRVLATMASKSSSSSGRAAATAARCLATVASSPRATGPVRARWGPSSTQFSTVERTSGPSRARASSTPAAPAIDSAAASSVTRKFEAIEAAAW